MVDRWGGASVMVWRGISTELGVISGNLSAQRYISLVLRHVVLPFLNAHRDIKTMLALIRLNSHETSSGATTSM